MSIQGYVSRSFPYIPCDVNISKIYKVNHRRKIVSKKKNQRRKEKLYIKNYTCGGILQSVLTPKQRKGIRKRKEPTASILPAEICSGS